jgi:hypothetical protein
VLALVAFAWGISRHHNDALVAGFIAGASSAIAIAFREFAPPYVENWDYGSQGERKTGRVLAHLGWDFVEDVDPAGAQPATRGARTAQAYSALVRRNAWAWSCLGQASEQLEDWEGAEYAYAKRLRPQPAARSRPTRGTDSQLCSGTSRSCGRTSAGDPSRPVAVARESERRYGGSMNQDPIGSQLSRVVLGERFEQALQFAAATHRTQLRKGSGIPYVGHLLGVCSLVIEDGGGEDEAIAALLHDAPEDQGGELKLNEIRTRFGDHVADIVAACSDTFEVPKPPWRARKENHLRHLSGQPEAALRVSLADKLFNARAILRDYLVVGDELWARFQSGRDGQLWYYRELADRFAAVVDDLEQAVRLD